MADRFNQVFGAFVGAADAVMALQARGTAQRDSNLRAQMALQGMRHEEVLLPLKMQLMREEVATRGLMRFGNLIDYQLKLKLAADQSAADTAAGAYFGGLMEEYSAWRAGGAGTDDVGAPMPELEVIDDAGAPYDAGGGGGVDDPVQGGFGDIELPVGGADGPADLLLPAGLVEGQGDGPELGGIAGREMARRRAAGGMTGIAAREMERRQRAAELQAKGSVTFGSGGIGGLSEPIPEPGSVRMLRKIERAVQMHGGPGAMARRHPARLAQLIEMKAGLESDREALRWKEAQAIRKIELEERAKAQIEAEGIIVSNGLRREDYPDIFEAVSRGVKLDPVTVKERVIADKERMQAMRSGPYLSLPEPVQKRAEVLSSTYLKSPEFTNFSLASGFAESVKRLVEMQNDGEASAAGDMALIYNYMKVLDPGSAVKEGEYATAEKAGSVPDAIVNLYNKAREGEFLTEKQRADFGRAAETSILGLQAALAGRRRIIDAQISQLVPPNLLPGLRIQVFGDDGAAVSPGAAATTPGAVASGDGLPSFSSNREMYDAWSKGLIQRGQPVTVNGVQVLVP